MALPKYDDLYQEVLTFLSANGPTSWRQLELPVADQFQLTQEDLAVEYASGNGTIFLDRLSWCISYLKSAELIYRPKRGVYEITPLGKSLLIKPDEIKPYIKAAIKKRGKDQSALPEQGTHTVTSISAPAHTTPHEQLLQAFDEIRAAEYELILDAILSKTPYEFERLVVKLLEKMG
ncbi:MAG: hypothetical protein RL497_3084, partial [Pseudomonadota bacterium]